jgi:hypothetical protein
LTCASLHRLPARRLRPDSEILAFTLSQNALAPLKLGNDILTAAANSLSRLQQFQLQAPSIGLFNAAGARVAHTHGLLRLGTAHFTAITQEDEMPPWA